jgi:hypothetical protein
MSGDNPSYTIKSVFKFRKKSYDVMWNMPE